MDSMRSVFFGCNYNDKRIKSRFDHLKAKLEAKYPIECIIIDKQRKRPAKDIWREIREAIEASSILVFDVSGFRPNVVVELGYALAKKNEDQLLVTVDERKKKGKKKSTWLLSDIGHLYTKHYKLARDLERYVLQQIKRSTYFVKLKEFKRLSKKKFNKEHSKIIKCGNKIMRVIRDEGAKSHYLLKSIAEKEECRLGSVLSLLRKENLLKGGAVKVKFMNYEITKFWISP